MPKYIEFAGIDHFNRPVFKRVGGVAPTAKGRVLSYYYGSTDILFDRNATESEVLAKVTESDLCFFGNRFGCEPCGSVAPNNLKIRSKCQ